MSCGCAVAARPALGVWDAEGLKRDPALAQLSRDHHHALVLAQRLRRATDADAAAVADAFLDHWKSEEREHFRIEEEVLLPALARHGVVEHPSVSRVLLDHVRIRADAEQVARAPTVELLHRLGARLAAHVRLEENELFPLVERELSADALRELGTRLAGH